MKELNNTVSNFLNKEYKDFSIYTVEERAIPSLCDGLKPGARKIIHAACTGSLKNGSTNKLLALSGDTMKLSLFAHGDASLNSTICTLSRSFSNNLNALEIEGQGGTLRDPDAGSPRYLYIRHSKYMDLIYKTDYELLDFIFDEGQYVEPMQYLPIIPNILCNMAMGIANGYSYHCMAYHPIDVIDACLDILSARGNAKEKIHTVIRPYLRDISQKDFRNENGVWMNYGQWKFDVKRDVMTVTALPYDMTYVEFEKVLNKLCDKQFIKDYKNKSEDGNVNYEIVFYKKQLEAKTKRDKKGISLANHFKLIKQIPDDLLWVLDENHKLKHFDSKEELLEYFVNWRLGIYTERKKRLVKILQERFKKNSDLVKFIELVCKGKLKIRNRSKKDIKVDMDNFKLPMELIGTPMSKCTIEERDELLKQNKEIEKELEYIKKTTEKQMYINDLKELRKNLEKDFK